MKYIIELEPIEGTDLFKAKGENTLVFDKKGIENILTPLEEPKEREIDWTKVPKDTPVLVWRDGCAKERRYFKEVSVDGQFLCYNLGATSWSVKFNLYTSWEYCELAFPEQAKEEWFKYRYHKSGRTSVLPFTDKFVN